MVEDTVHRRVVEKDSTPGRVAEKKPKTIEAVEEESAPGRAVDEVLEAGRIVKINC